MFTVFIICNNIFIPVVWKVLKTEVPVLIFGQKKHKLYCPWDITPVMKMKVIAAALWSHVTCVVCIETGCWLCIKLKTNRNIENEAATSLSMLWTEMETMEILSLACDEAF